jgi:benzoate-CoA ligase family protein
VNLLSNIGSGGAVTYNAAEWLLDRNIGLGRGGTVAIRCRGESTTYAELLGETWRAQHALEELSVGAGDRVLMVVNDEREFVACFLGCLRSGVVPVPVSTMATPGDLAAIAADSGARVLVASAQYADRIAVIAAGAPSLGHAVVIGDVAGEAPIAVSRWSDVDDVSEAPVAPTDADSQAFWLYSSGTTGIPKGVIHRHADQQATFDTYAVQVLRAGPDDRFLSIAKLFFAYGLGNSLTFPLAAGGTAILEPRPPTPRDIAELVGREQATLFFASPGFVAAVLDADLPDETFASVRCTVTAGEALPAELQKRFSSRFGHPVLDGIGSTEALHIFLSNTIDEQRPGTSGRVVPGYEAVLRDDNDREITDAETSGYLYVRGPSTASGYWQRDEATAATFRDGWLKTGDVYTKSHDGYWTFLGRNNDMIKAGGIWVSPAEVESVLVAHPDVLEAAVVGARSDTGLEATVAFVVPRSGRSIDAAAIDAHCRERMASFKRPRQLFVVDELPKTATGKIRRFALREQLTNALKIGTD